MRLAFLILAHHLPEQLARLVGRLQAPNRRFLIHVDQHANGGEFEKMRQLTKAENVLFTRRYRSGWGSFGLLRAEVQMLQTLVESGNDFDYAVLLSGQDYPLKSNESIDRALANAAGSSFMKHQQFPFPTWCGAGYPRIRNWHFRFFGRTIQFPDCIHRRLGTEVLPYRKMVRDWTPYGGSQMWTLHRDCVNHVYLELRKHPEVLRFFRHVGVADEIFFQTVLLNSPLRETIVNDNQRLIVNVGEGGSRGKVFTSADLPELRASSALFARKFDIRIDAQVLDEIDSW